MKCPLTFTVFVGFFLVSSTASLGAGELPRPVADYTWSPEQSPSGAAAPNLIAFRGGSALEFSNARKTVVDLAAGPQGEGLRLTGPLTLAMVVQLTAEPETKKPFVSKWHCTDGGRSYELGIMPDRRLFLAISASGKYDGHAKEVFSTRILEIGRPYAIVGVFEPEKQMAIYVNGFPSGRLRGDVPSSIHDNPTPALLGARPPVQLHVDALIGKLSVFDCAFDPKSVTAWAESQKLTDDPGPAMASFEDALFAEDQKLPPVRAITRGPKFHWFSYYDKFQFDPTDRYALGMEVDFEHRSPKPDDVIKIGMVDLEDDDRWIELGESRAWCWQQGCMLQWRPGSDTEILWNDRDDDRFVCRVLDVETRQMRTLPAPIHHVSPNGKSALVTDVGRVGEMRPGYGYVGIADQNRDVMAPEDSGLWLMDLDTGESRLAISIAQVAKIPYRGQSPDDKHYFNHIQWSPDGKRFLFLNRGRGVSTRMFTAGADGSDLRLVNLNSSHYTWRDSNTILVWVGSYLLVPDDDSLSSTVLWRAPNGHQSYIPGTNLEWIVTDTYPMGTPRQQHLYLYHVPTKRIVPIGHFDSPPEYGGEWRCDTHPRVSRDGTKVVFDSPCGGNGRQMYLIDIDSVIGKERSQ